MLLKFTARQAHSCVAQWQSIRLLIGRLLVRVQPQELIARSPSLTGWGSEVFWSVVWSTLPLRATCGLEEERERAGCGGPRLVY